MPDAVTVVDREYRFAWVNAAMESFLGLPRDQIIGKTCYSLIHKTGEPVEGCLFRRLNESLHRESIEIEIPEKKTWIKVTVDPVVDARGRLSGAIHYLSDITPIKEAEKATRNEIIRLGLLNRLELQVVREPDFDALLKEAARDICESLSLSRCAIWIPGDPERSAESCGQGVPPSDPGFSFYRRLACKEEDFASGNVVVGDVSASSLYDDRREEMERFRVGAFLVVPLRIREEWIGFLFLSRREPHAWTDACVATAETVGRTIVIAVHHSKILRG
ncbi:MAG: multi-sensor signal transduction histidine kinase [Actinobacteria bacterium]|nr:multi-sensor signal transduction histidine kinase [Actinomycetota bacterium]